MAWNNLTSVNPVNGKIIREYSQHEDAELPGILNNAGQAFTGWQHTGFELRSRLMMQVAKNLRTNKEGYARLITSEMGKPLQQSKAEIEKCAVVCEYYAEKAEGFLANEYVEAGGSVSYIAFRPLGTILAVMPWNFPFWQVFRFAAPALMAGNGVLLKHASNVTGCALAIEELFERSGAIPGLFRVLRLSSSRTGQIIENPVVRAVTLTGSVDAGKAVAEHAGSFLKKTVLELGGSDPYIILADADLKEAARICADSRLINNGQSCIAAKRFIVDKTIIVDFERLFVSEMKERTMGDPMDENNDIGPMASTGLRDELHRQVLRSIGEGAKCLLGGEIPRNAGAWYPPTVLSGVRPGMPAYGEEIFGPVAAVIEAEDEADAIRIANDTSFGLGAAVFTRDKDRGQRIAEESLQAGCCFVNDSVRSDPRLPFGGIGNSGYGRELSYFGIREFTNIKTVFVS